MRGETVTADVVAHPASGLSPADEEAFRRDRMAVYKVPHQIELVDSTPKSARQGAQTGASRAVAAMAGTAFQGALDPGKTLAQL